MKFEEVEHKLWGKFGPPYCEYWFPDCVDGSLYEPLGENIIRRMNNLFYFEIIEALENEINEPNENRLSKE